MLKVIKIKVTISLLKWEEMVNSQSNTILHRFPVPQVCMKLARD